MKTLVILLFIAFFQYCSAQQYYAEYNFVRKMKLFGKEKVDSSQLDVLKYSDTAEVKPGEVYISGTVRSYTNDTLNILHLTIEQSTDEELIKPGKEIHCLINYEQHIIRDKERNTSKTFSLPDLSTLATKGNSFKMVRNDTLCSHAFYWNEESYEIVNKKDVPPNVRGTALNTSDDWGVSLLRTSDRLYELKSYKEISEEDLQRVVDLYEDCCTEKEEGGVMILL